MSRTKDLKNQTENNINVFELFSLLVPNNKSKYVETLLRISRNTPRLDGHIKDIMTHFKAVYNIPFEKFDNKTNLEIIFFNRVLDSLFNEHDLKSFQKFCEYNERGLIKQNDLSRYNSFEQILNALNVAELVSDSKDLEKQIKVVFENNEWILVRPLTFLSSKKYGSNTKWCTTIESDPGYFLKYSRNGVLIYSINKLTGYKVASFYSLDKENREFSFWDQKDSRVDSLDTELTDELRKIILNESKGLGAKTNRFLLSDEERIKEDEYLKRNDLLINKYPEPVSEIAEGEDRGNYIRRAVERATNELQDNSVDTVVETEATMSFVPMDELYVASGHTMTNL
jgi:hypothetical protein